MKYGNIDLHNVSDIKKEHDDSGFIISRLPLKILPAINKGAKNMSFLSGGAEIRGMLPEKGKAKVTLQVLDDNVVPPIVTVFFGSFRSKQILLEETPMEIIIEEPDKMELMEKIHRTQPMIFHPRLIRIMLPHIHKVKIIKIEGDMTFPVKEALPEKTLLCYGSSITHGAHAIPPEGTYASQCSYHLGYDLINLGSGGSAQMDEAVADHIASRNDWDIATLEMGINVREWPPEKFHEVVKRFVNKIVSSHPEKYIFCIDLFTNTIDFMEQSENALEFRGILQKIVKELNSSKVIHIDGREILTNPAGLQTDLTHPNDNGMVEMGRNLAEKILGKLQLDCN